MGNDSRQINYKNILKRIASLAVVLIILYIFVKWLFPLVAPFIIAFLISTMMEPFVSLLEERVHIPRKISSLIATVLFVTLFGTLIALISINLYREAQDLKNNITLYVKDANNDLFLLFNQAKNFYFNLPEQVISALQQYSNTFTNSISKFIKDIIDGTFNVVFSLPRAMFFILFTIISTYYFSSERRMLRSFVYKQLSRNLATRIYNVKTDILAALVGYVKAYSILFVITFIELAIGLAIIGKKYALVIALFISIVDLLPILGSGTILIPWAIWLALTGDLTQALGIFILYVVILVVRQFFEPKIVGSQVGLHPLVTVIAMYIGLSLAGFAGLFLGPITVILLKNLQKAGLIQLWVED